MVSTERHHRKAQNNDNNQKVQNKTTEDREERHRKPPPKAQYQHASLALLAGSLVYLQASSCTSLPGMNWPDRQQKGAFSY